MKKVLSFSMMIVLSMCLSIMVYANENDAFKFRGYEWGTPLEDIKAKEITDGMIDGYDYDIREDEKALIALTKVANIDLFAYFRFDDDLNLSYGFYQPQTSFIKNDIQYYSDFETIDNALIGLYGEPERFATVIDVDDVEDMSRDEIISKIVQNNASIVHRWTADDGSEIYAICCFYGGHVYYEIYYVQSEEQFQEISASQSAASSEGL